jgi:UDP-N-acetylmuramoyl-L-alanyl-D-glutamate--2,6-diaminopimelate ligase
MEAFRLTVAEAVRQQTRTLAVETTSKALSEGFARRWPADVAVFTNLTRDHLDVHGSPEAYLAAKAQLFMTVPSDGVVVWNLADPCSALLNEVVPPQVRRLGYVVGDVHPDCASLPRDLWASGASTTIDETPFELSASPALAGLAGLAGPQRLSVVGAVHVQNALAAALATAALGYDAHAITRGLTEFTGVPGRFEVVASHPTVVVDYAHTPDALARTLTEARHLARAQGGQLCCVLGCGGGRDQGKRPEMGRVADELADDVIVTTDNPRSEDPAAILDAIESGVRSTERHAVWRREPDRRAAIHAAIACAAPADLVVIAGRGHETQQLFATGPVPFCDRSVAREALRDRDADPVP